MIQDSGKMAAAAHTAMGKIIQFRAPATEEPAPPSVQERGRHFLKFALPAIPVAVFTSVFLLCYSVEAADATSAGRVIDPAAPLLGALGVTLLISVLCIAIYEIYRRITA